MLYCCDFQNLEKLHKEGMWQGTGLETQAWKVALCAKEDPRETATHEEPRPGKGEVDGMDQHINTAVH